MPSIGPVNPFSEHLHAIKYRADGESFDDYCVRYSRTLADDERHFRHLLGGLREQRILPAGRQQLAIGRPFQTTAFNCLAGDTPVLTLEYGTIPIERLAGEALHVCDGKSAWELASFRSFGQQAVHALRLTRRGRSVLLHATADHEWLVDGRKAPTSALRAGTRIDFIPNPVFLTNTTEYQRGLVHGLVYGDGTRNDGGFNLRLCKGKEPLEEWLVSYPWSRPPSCGGDKVFYFYGENAWYDLKQLPPTCYLDYLAGFLRGWLAADGSVSEQPEVTLCMGPEEEAWLRQFGPVVGFQVVGSSLLAEVTNLGRRNKLSRNVRLDRRFLGEADFLRPEHRARFRPDEEAEGRWRVATVSREPVGEAEVYCPQVHTTASFALAGGIHSGNCYVGGTIEDSMLGIMEELKDSAITLRAGGGCGWDFSTLRPQDDPIYGLGPGARASGPVGFMPLWNAMCDTIMSAGMRRGAMMGVLCVTHPDILKFIRAKRQPGALTNFNISVACTRAFMEAVATDGLYDLTFGGRVYRRVRALDVWATIMESNWDWAEPGVLFIDRINEMNPLYYCEVICSTNPCLAAGTLVSTSRGLVPVEQCGVGTEVATVTGTGKVQKVEVHEDVEVFEVLLSDGTRLEATAAHIFHTCRGETKRWDTETRLRDLRLGDKVRLAPGACPHNPLTRSLLGLSDRDAGFFVGLVMGDGCYTEATAQLKISVGWHECDWHTTLCEFLDRVGFPYRRDDNPSNTARVIVLPKEVKTALTEFGFPTGYANQKYLPLPLINTNAEFLHGFVDGYVSTDGNVHMAHRNPMIRISTSSRASALSAQRVFHLLGIHARIYANKRGKRVIAGRELKGGASWTVVLLGANLAELYRRVKLTHPEKASRLRQLALTYRLSGETWAAAVRSIRSLGPKRVYDLYEPETDTWIAEGTVSRGCGEQPLPPRGACLLGSLNLVKYLVPSYARPLKPPGFDVATYLGGRGRYVKGYELDLDLFVHDARAAVRAFDNVIENTVYPLEAQRLEATNKRRMGLGVTGVANALEVCGFAYGTDQYLQAQEKVLALLRDTAYRTSIGIAREKGSFPLFDADMWLSSGFARTLPDEIRADIKRYGLRNGLLLSIAPTGTISLTADNVSSGIEPPPCIEQTREVNLPEGKVVVELNDYAWTNYGVRCRTGPECSPTDHVRVLCSAQRFVESAVSKTVNIKGARAGNDPQPGEITFAEFKDLYWHAYEGGAKGCTTYNMNGKRAGIITDRRTRGEAARPEAARSDAETLQGESVEFRNSAENPTPPEGAACFADPKTGQRSCDF